MSSRMSAAFIMLTLTVASASTAIAQRSALPPPHPGRDLLAALGTATLDCLGTVGPNSFETSTGYLKRTFMSCPVDGEALARIDALLGVQHSDQGYLDDLAGYYVSTWNTFIRRFPHGRIRACPSWTLLNVIDAPTPESVARLTRLGRPGKQNQRYLVTSDDCRTSGCAVDRAVICAGGFGDGFVVEADRERGLIELDPAWWLLDLEFERDCSWEEKFAYLHGYCDALESPLVKGGTLYGAIQRAGEKCCYWYSPGGPVTTDGTLVPIDCGGGWYCMTVCGPPGSAAQ